jgi:hypothetical protein
VLARRIGAGEVVHGGGFGGGRRRNAGGEVS